MTDFLTALSKGFTAFTATNLDDIVILLLFFSQVTTLFRRRHIVMGQYLGFAALILMSLPSFFGSLLLPRPWVGLLGIVPIAIGISRLLNPNEDDEAEATDPVQPSFLSHILSPQTYSVAAVTFANGGDNVGIYVPLFASSTWENLLVILTVFFTLVGVWCYAAHQLTRIPAIAQVLTRYGNQLIPFVLVGLGILILVDSHTLENRGLTVIALALCGLCVLRCGGNVTLSLPTLTKLREPSP
jgi:cadmium resistance transport/sequestration family protein